jgi:hypothetical protein
MTVLIDFAEFRMEGDVGLPSDVVEGMIPSERFCPWSSEGIAFDE